jgi:23S rRNA (cytosine1962-C5)-methyltransferase
VQTIPSYELLDVGGGARLERFGERITDRPHPGALGSRRAPRAWLEADLRYDRDGGWTGPAVGSPWSIELEGLTLELRPTDTGQVGIFPEHLATLPWLTRQVAGWNADRGRAGSSPSAVLHLFAYTGLITLAMAAAGAHVTHVDSARPTVAWARRNAAASGLDDRPIRWIVDDALTFSAREARRGRRFAGVVLDPPTYGHGPASRSWRIEDHLSELLEAIASVLEPDGFVLLTAHSPGFEADRLASELGRALASRSAAIERGQLDVTATDGRRLELGAFARFGRGAS